MAVLLYVIAWLVLPLYGLVLVWRLLSGREDGRFALERFGLSTWRPPEGPVLWMHGVSVGESLALEGLMRALLDRYPRLSIVLTTSTRASARMWRTKLVRDSTLAKRLHLHMLPFDHPLFWALFLRRVRPCGFLLSENDFWPFLFLALKRRSIFASVLGARMSSQSQKRWSRFRGLMGLMLKDVVCCVPSQDQKELFDAIGAGQTKVVSSLKWTKCSRFFKSTQKSHDYDLGQLWSGVSTHAGEEAACLAAHRLLRSRGIVLNLVLAPRHLHRLARVVDVVRAEGLNPVLWSELRGSLGADDVLIVDQMGKLKHIYDTSALVFVGGSLNPGIGGHDIIDPAGHGCAIMCGPFTDNQKEVVDCFRAHDAVRIIDRDTFPQEVMRLLKDDAERARQAKAGQDLVASEHKNVLATYMRHLEPGLVSCA